MPKKENNSYRPKTHLRFSWGLVINVLLVGVGLAIIGYTADLLIKNKISTYAAIAVIVVDSLSVIWNISVLRKRSSVVGAGRAIFTIVILVIITLVVCAYTGVQPFSGYKDDIGNYFNKASSTVSESNPTSAPLRDTVFNVDNIQWEVSLNSIKWNKAKVSISLSITNKGTIPADFPYSDIAQISFDHSTNFQVVDSYGLSFSPDNNAPYTYYLPTTFYIAVYPKETRNINLGFEVNPMSGDITLYVTRSIHTETQQIRLFALGSPQ